MVFRFKPSFELLETREVPAVNWDWAPRIGSMAGDDPLNWTNDSGLVNQIPDDAADNVNLAVAGNKPCNFGNNQNALGSITVANTYTSTIKLGDNTAFQACSILGACTIDLDGKQCNFGNVGANPGVIGNQANGIRVTFTGGGIIEVNDQEKLDLSNVTLASSVNVNAGGKLYFGYITYGNHPFSSFNILDRGTMETNSPNATFISNSSQGVYGQPIRVHLGGNLNFVTSATVVSFIDCQGTVTVKGTQASPNVTLTITGKDPWDAALRVWGTGSILNLAAGSIISGNVFVHGGMNLFDPPTGSAATVCTIVQGDFKMLGQQGANAILNLNNLTLNIANGTAYFYYADVRTNVAYSGANDEVRMGNITVNGNVHFEGINNALTQTFTGTPKAFDLPLLTYASVDGGFSTFLHPADTAWGTAGNTLRIWSAN